MNAPSSPKNLSRTSADSGWIEEAFSDIAIDSAELAEDLTRIERAERAELDRKRQEELARLRELARFD